MSEIINNREYRQNLLKELIKDLHNGKSLEEVKKRFKENFENVSSHEIAEMEQSLIAEGMPIEEIQRLCDVHASVFKGSIEDIHRPEEVPGHPVHTFKMENKEIKRFIDEQIKVDLLNFKNNDNKENVLKLIEDFNLLWDIDKHYSRKENLLFSYLEKHGLSSPTKVMWGVDDEIRNDIKTAKKALVNYNGNKEEVIKSVEEAIYEVDEMIFKEENILFPMALDNLTEDEWIKILDESDLIGYCMVEPTEKWKPLRFNIEEQENGSQLGGYVRFETGILKPKEISEIFNHLPVDVTFIDKDDVVRYFSQTEERIFMRTKSVIGRKVQNCHPPASVHIVEKIVEDFKSGKKDNEDFWIKMGGMYVLIRYFAVRDKNGEYIGSLEVTQNIKPIQEIEGEKRIMD